MSVLTPGVCRHCGCTDELPCAYCKGVHGGSAWLNSDRLVCSSPQCVRGENDRVSAARQSKRSKFAGMGYGAIRAELRKKDRARARKKGRAA